MEPVSTMLGYWGKARNSDADGPPYHLLAYHSLDVAAVAAEWWEQSRVLRSQCCYATGLEEEQTCAWVVFFIALHDYGKWDIRFQLKAPHALQPLYPAFTPALAEPDSRYFHGPQGYAWFIWEDSSRLGLSDESRESWQPWLAAVTGHHGSLPDNAEAAAPIAAETIIERDCTARIEWLRAIEALFLRPAGLCLEELPPPARICWPDSVRCATGSAPMTNDFLMKPRSTPWWITGGQRVSTPGQHQAKVACAATLWGLVVCGNSSLS